MEIMGEGGMSAAPDLNAIAQAFNASGHSVFGPSGSAMWMVCAGSLIPNMLAKDQSSKEAAEGTVAHDVAEGWLRTGKKPRHLVGSIRIIEENGEKFRITITRKMLDFVQEYVDWCTYLDGDHFIETRVYFDELTPIPNQSGTADHAACMPGRLVITDLKYGAGIQVFAYKNPQAMIYALGFFLKYDWLYDFQEIVIRICQPRFDHFDEWTVSREELLAFGEDVKDRAAKAWKVNAPRRPGPKQCQWCKVRATCAAIPKLIDAVLEGNIKDMDREYSSGELDVFLESIMNGTYRLRPLVVDDLTTDHLVKVLPYRKLIEGWFKRVDLELASRALSGDTIPQHKLVESRTDREFEDEETAAETLRLLGLEESEIYTRKLASPAQAEDLLREKFGIPRKEIPDILRRYWRKPAGRPVLVPETDKRPPYRLQFDDVFDESDIFDEDDEL